MERRRQVDRLALLQPPPPGERDREQNADRRQSQRLRQSKL